MCQLHGDNCIGNNGITLAAPRIGNRVDIGVGAKIIGNIEIADDIVIGAGAVVNKSFKELEYNWRVPARVKRSRTCR